MRWQKVARIVVAAIGLGTAAAVYFMTRERTAAEPPPVAKDADPAAKMQAGAGKDLRYRDDELLGTLTYASVRYYENNNRFVWEKFDYRLNDGTRLVADRAEAQGNAGGGGKPDEISLKGHVRLETKEGTELKGDSGTYSDITGLARIPGRVSFTKGRMSGTGKGGTYERETGIFKLLEDAQVDIAAEQESEPPMRASGSVMTYTRDAQSMLFEKDAKLERAADTLVADNATLHLSPDETRIRSIELRGHSHVAPVKGQTSDLPEMTANDIDLGFYDGGDALQEAHLLGDAVMHQPTPEGWRSIEGERIDFTTAADGKTLTSLNAIPASSQDRIVVRLPAAQAAPARTITSATLASTGDEKRGLTSAVFEGGVEFVESTGGRGTAAGKRVGKSRTLRLVIKGQLDQIEEARFDQAVEITDGSMHGYGDTGVYRAGSGEMDLQPNRQAPGRKARVTDAEAGMVVEAVELITAYLDTGGLYARGEVTTVTTQSKASSPSNNNSIFNATDPIYGSASEFRYDDAAKVATYDGKGTATARVTQPKSNAIVIGDHIEYFSERQDLVAKGHVNSTFDIAPTPAEGRAQKTASNGTYNALADTLVYTEKTRTATYTGSARLRNPDGETTADAMDLLLAKASRSLDRLDATGTVHAVLSKGEREARGDRLVYDATPDQYQLWGKPLTLINKEADGTCYAQEGTMARFKGELGAPEFPSDQNAAGGAPRRSIPCPAPGAR